MGTVVVSVDAELGWGFHDLPPAERPTQRIERSRQAWLTLIELFAEFEIPATWAVVGHLLEPECDGRHDDHPTPEGWFAHEREPDPMPDRYRAGPALVDRLLDTAVDHDVGSHTYSHVEFGADYATATMARAECRRAVETAASMDLSLDSFVFPRNNVGHREVLADAGFTTYRSVAPNRKRRSLLPRPARKVARATVVDSPPPLVTPTVDEHGLVDIPASLFLFEFEGVARRAAVATVGDPIVKQAKLGIDAAADGEGVCHLWLHPNNVVDQRDIDRLDRIFDYIDRTRAETDLTVETMRDVAERTLERETTPQPTD